MTNEMRAKRGDTGRRARPAATGFSLIELVIVVVIIAIISAVAIPKMSRGAAGAGDSALISDLSTMRSALELYAQEHGGNYPTATTSAQFLAQMTTYTDAIGTTSATRTTACIYGPYLKSVPAQPVGTNKGCPGVVVVTTAPGNTTGAASSTPAPNGNGWIYDTQTIWAYEPATDVDVNGTKYQAY